VLFKTAVERKVQCRWRKGGKTTLKEERGGARLVECRVSVVMTKKVRGGRGMEGGMGGVYPRG